MKSNSRTPVIPYAITKAGAPGRKLLKDFERALPTCQTPVAKLLIWLCVGACVACDAYTIFYYVQFTFNDVEGIALFTALMIAFLVDGAPFLLGKTLSRPQAVTQGAKQRRRCFCLAYVAVFVQAYGIFLGLAALYAGDSLTQTQATGFAALGTGSQTAAASFDWSAMIRALLPIPTSIFSLILGLAEDPQRQRIDQLLARKKRLHWLLRMNQNIVAKYREDLQAFDVDRYDRACAEQRLQSLAALAEQNIRRARELLAAELGTEEAADHLLQELRIPQFWEELSAELDIEFGHRSEDALSLPEPVPVHAENEQSA